MQITIRTIVFLFFTILTVFPYPKANADGLVNDGPLRTATFWQQHNADGDSLVLTDAQKTPYNHAIQQSSPAMVDMADYPTTESRDTVKQIIEASSVVPDEAYDEFGQSLSQSAIDDLLHNRGLENIPDTVSVRMGVTVRRSSIRTLPTADPIFEEPQASMFDSLQETAIDPAEAVLILHTSNDGQYYYIQMYNYSGWVATADIALTNDRKQWLNYVNPQKFLTVTGKSYQVTNGTEMLFYQMGSRISFTQKNKFGYTIILPQRDAQGNLKEKSTFITSTTSLHEGYLPYTRNNIIQEAFYYLDEPYGWGGLKNSVDCSSFIANLYRTVGIFLPRNADQQETVAGQHFPFTDLDENGIYNSIAKNCRPGDAFFMDGHVMLYLGEVDNVPYVIDALGSYTQDIDGQKIRHHILHVVVNDLSLTVFSGKSFAAVLTSAVSFHQ